MYDVNYFIGSSKVVEQMKSIEVLQPFDARITSFISALSRSILVDPISKTYPEVYTFAFWCRESGLKQMQKKYPDIDRRRGRGMVLHYAPSNIPVHFAYLLVVGLLSGNANVVRVSSKSYPQNEFVMDKIAQLLESGFSDLKKYIVICNFKHSKAINDWLSGKCDARVIFGEDGTVLNISESTLMPGALNICFPDRYSICVIEAENYLKYDDKMKLAIGFYNDNYLFDQKSCSSARIVLWIGKPAVIVEAKKYFWKELEHIVLNKYELAPSKVLSKIETISLIAVQFNSIKMENFQNFIHRLTIENLDSQVYDFQCAYGLFIEMSCLDLKEAKPVLTSKLQTISKFGIDSAVINCFLQSNQINGVDRIVEIGQALNFDLIWDGIDLVEVLTRKRNF